MAPRLTLLSSLLFLLLSCAASDLSNPIRMVSNRLDSSSIVQALGQTRHALSFARFSNRYGKSYETVEEIKLRFAIFSENLKLIRSENKNALPYTLAVNHFADWTWEEFRSQRLGAAQNCSATLKGNHKLTDVVLPEMKDWREDGIVSPVKNQGHCGSCWTFSTTGALEAAYHQAFGKEISLSEQQLVDCAGAFNNFGCRGGLPSQAYEYIKYNGGLDTEEAYPYTATDGTCKFSSANVGVQVVSSVNITEAAEDELKHAVAFTRPVSVAFEVVNGFRFYKEGVYSSDTCGSAPTDVNHAVLAVGYGVENGFHIGSLRIRGEQIGVTMATSRWKWARTCVTCRYCNLCIIPCRCLKSVPEETEASLMSELGHYIRSSKFYSSVNVQGSWCVQA